MAFNQRDLFSLKQLAQKKGNCFSHNIPFQHFIKNINESFLNSVFCQIQAILCRWAQAATERQMRVNILWYYLLLHIRLNRFPCLVVRARFSSPTAGPRETVETNEVGGREICTHHKYCSQWMLKYHSYSMYLSVQVEELKNKLCWQMGPAVLKKSKRWSPARKGNGC